jgi:hypothetical protein
MKHVVVAGDCMTSIAARYGFSDPKRIMNAPENAQLMKVRPGGNLLHPGDEVFVPELTSNTVSAATGQQHKFQVTVPKRLLRVKFLGGDGTPMKGNYTLRAGSLEIQGSLDGNGVLEQKLPAHLKDTEVEMGGVMRTILIGHLNPLRDTPDGGVTGAQARLSNLGFPAGARKGPRKRGEALTERPCPGQNPACSSYARAQP